jgi:hypothetical protein
VTDARYHRRLDALEAVWGRWAEIGTKLPPHGWSAATRRPGWDVAALYAHVGLFPRAVADPPAVPQARAGDGVAGLPLNGPGRVLTAGPAGDRRPGAPVARCPAVIAARA